MYGGPDCREGILGRVGIGRAEKRRLAVVSETAGHALAVGHLGVMTSRLKSAAQNPHGFSFAWLHKKTQIMLD